MKSYSSREVIQLLEADDWYFVKCVGDHHQYKHPTKQGKVTITHPRKDIPLGTLKSIQKQANITFL
jgi:predicted RNA binding protein YcfA (HicA-like mRNA interferase family)